MFKYPGYGGVLFLGNEYTMFGKVKGYCHMYFSDFPKSEFDQEGIKSQFFLKKHDENAHKSLQQV
jgi:hypothetical protein